MTNVLKTKANMKAVISHSKVFATSAALSFFCRDDLSGPSFGVLSGDINVIPVFQPAVDCFTSQNKNVDYACKSSVGQ